MATRKSVRNSPTEIFKNIYGVEGTADSPPVVVEFQKDLATENINFKHEMETGDLKYAPSDKNPYYMCLHHTQLAGLLRIALGGCKWATPAPHSSFGHRPEPDIALRSYSNISLKLFYDMANDQVDWLALSNLKDPQVVTTPEEREKEAAMLKEMAFAALLDPPQRDPLDGRRYDEQDPVMQIEGEAIELPPPLVYQNPPSKSSIDYEMVRWDVSCEIAQNKPRRAYIPIRHPQGWLIWLRLPDWNRDRQARRGQLVKLKKEFEKLWMYSTATDPETAAGYRPRYSSADFSFPLYVVPQPIKLKLRLGWKANQIDTQFAGLVGQINTGRTQPNMGLIIATTEQVGRDGLIKMGESPFDLFTTYISADDFDRYMKGLEVLTGTDQTLTRKNAHRSKEATDARLKTWLRGNYDPMTDDYTSPQENTRGYVQDWKTRRGNLYSEEGKCGSTWCIGVGRDKIKDAGGKRIAKYSPKEIMGMSANEAAENAFGWKTLDQAHEYLGHKHRLSSGMYMAEWLHLCAFSWGGLTTSPKKAELVYRSSDIPENLIIGTSETNSVMTRFEKAWQSLVRDESSLKVKGQENSSFSAKLVVTRNHSKEPVIRDQKENNTYSRTSSSITTAECATAKLYHFVAYTVSYSIEFPKCCRLLAMPANSRLETTFYPFLRPLYHRLEDQLDQMLYERIKARFKGDPISAGVDATSTSGAVFDGTMLQSLSLVDGTGPYTVEKKKGRSKKAKGNHPYNTAGEMQQGAGTNPFLGSEEYEEVNKKLKTY